MQHYLQYQKGITPAGAIVVRFHHSGDEIRGYVRQITADENDDSIFPGEELEPEVALRLAGNKQHANPGSTIYIELSEGVQWNPAWDDVAADAR